MKPLLAILIVLQAAAWTQQAAPGYLEISGDVPHPRTFQEQEWKAMKHVSVIATNAHDKKTSTFSGVPLLDILQSAGVPTGENLRGKALTTCVTITASDGYKVIFSLAELDAGIGARQVIVADSKDGKPLPSTAGPLRLIVTEDKRPARWVRMVKTIRVIANP
ncbi:MAG TPA: molybdopterin-dependent oxidoreductase [Candidatus Angelobacter sp.]|jgi:DMSO/TMAO reductase YedYZ molybdopterin-dependent catalytic subunit